MCKLRYALKGTILGHSDRARIEPQTSRLQAETLEFSVKFFLASHKFPPSVTLTHSSPFTVHSNLTKNKDGLWKTQLDRPTSGYIFIEYH